MTPTRRLPAAAALALLAGLAASAPADAQQYWMGGGMGGGYNAPNRALTDTMNEHMLQRHMTSRGAGGFGGGAAPGAGQAGAGQAGVASRGAGGDPSFRLSNTAGVQVNEVYVSSSSDNHWGQDRLGRNVLAPGQNLIVRLPMGQCVNDIRIVYANGRTQDRRGIDTCAITDVTLP